jgi:MerR family transcriptional regulator, light-induced transcriptional regulator
MTSDQSGHRSNSVDQSISSETASRESRAYEDCTATLGNAGLADGWKRPPRFASGNPSDLAGVISREIVPALLVTFGVSGRDTAERPPDLTLTAQDRAEFASSVLVLPARALTAIARQFIDMGFPVEKILLELLAPTARHLGVLWERDDISFIDVTIAVQKLQHVMHVVCQDDRPTFVDRDDRPSALMLPAPGEVHTFGLLIMSELLRRRGWVVEGGLPMPPAEIVQMAASSPYALIGFSLSSDLLLAQTANAIKRIRKKSRNTGVKIVIGGPVAAAHDIVQSTGADAAFADAADACTYADTVAAAQIRLSR